jgi:hypothetical protein
VKGEFVRLKNLAGGQGSRPWPAAGGRGADRLVSMDLPKEQRTFFADQLRSAREAALCDAEDFDQVIHAVERLGSYLCRKTLDLGRYKCEIVLLALQSPLAEAIPFEHRGSFTPFSLLYDLMRQTRNDALHQGAFARRLTDHAIQVAIVLEDALRRGSGLTTVSDFMVRNPMYAEDWQPLAFIRQTMLAHSFSWLPVKAPGGKWYMISDEAIVKFLTDKPNERNANLAMKFSAAAALTKHEVQWVEKDATLVTAVQELKGMPLFVHSSPGIKEPIGILTAFDLL